MAFITSPRGVPIYIDEAHSFLPWGDYNRVTPKQVYISTAGRHVAGMPQLDTLHHHATNCISPLKPEECFIFLTDTENNPSEVFTKLHQNTCEIMGINKDFSKQEAVNPYVSIAYTFPQITIAELKNRVSQIKLDKEK